MKRLKLGLLGTTGVGKDTCVTIIKDHFQEWSFSPLRLADPLYQAQEAIYKICQKEKDFYSQDGELLNFLGNHMRKINPNVLKESFLTKVQDCDMHILCPDIRAVDVPFMRQAGFTIIHIEADPRLTHERRQRRGDLSLGETHHATELGITPSLYDHRLVNNGSLEAFRTNIINLMTTLIL